MSTPIRNKGGAPTTAIDRCTTCKTTKKLAELFRCSKCQETLYCSRECQKKNWQEHKIICQELHQLGKNLDNIREGEKTEQLREKVREDLASALMADQEVSSLEGEEEQIKLERLNAARKYMKLVRTYVEFKQQLEKENNNS